MFDHVSRADAATLCDEEARLAALESCGVLDTPDEPVYDALTELAKTICGTSIGILSLVDRDRLWFKSRVGLEAREIPRSGSFCSSGIEDTKLFQVPNARNDPRFADNALVTGPLGIRFYCGVPLLGANGHRLGMLCVLDQRPRRLSDIQCNALTQLASVVMYLLENRRDKSDLLDLAVILERSRDRSRAASATMPAS